MEWIDWNGFRVWPWNVPQKRPGVYLLTCLREGEVLPTFYYRGRRTPKYYVGCARDVAGRLGFCYSPGTMFLSEAIAMFGHEGFLLEPILYQLEFDWKQLLHLEGLLTVEYDAVYGGFNSTAYVDGKLIQCSEAFLKKIEISNAKKAATNRVVWAQPRLREAQRARRRAYLADPANRARHTESMRSLYEGNDALKSKIGASVSRLMWITDGATDHRVSLDSEIPEGWRRGRVTGSFGPRPGKLRWVTNGVDERQVAAADPIPNGWRIGRGSISRAAMSAGRLSKHFAEDT